MDLVPELSEYYQSNSYVFSKHILEHLMAEKYSKLPICIVRPNIIAPPKSLDYGFDSKAPIPLLCALGPYPILLAPLTGGEASIVFIEDVASDIFQGLFRKAAPATKDDFGQPWHPIISCTNRSEAQLIQIMKTAIPWIPRVDIQQAWLRNLVREFEFCMVAAFLGRHAWKSGSCFRQEASDHR